MKNTENDNEIDLLLSFRYTYSKDMSTKIMEELISFELAKLVRNQIRSYLEEKGLDNFYYENIQFNFASPKQKDKE